MRGGVAFAGALRRAESLFEEVAVARLAEPADDDVDALLRCGGRVGLPARGVLRLGLTFLDGVVGEQVDELIPERVHAGRGARADEGDGLAVLQRIDEGVEGGAVARDRE